MANHSSATVPDDVREAINEDLARRGFEASNIGPGEPTLSMADHHEQYYVATVREPGGTDSLQLYLALRRDDEWMVSHVESIEK